jgi:hypothetical protein
MRGRALAPFFGVIARESGDPTVLRESPDTRFRKA